jgi:hypothetical protein
MVNEHKSRCAILKSLESGVDHWGGSDLKLRIDQRPLQIDY